MIETKPAPIPRQFTSTAIRGFMKIAHLCICLSGFLYASHIQAAPARDFPPSDSVTEIENKYWNFTKKENSLPHNSEFLGVNVIECKSRMDEFEGARSALYTELLRCSVKISYRRPSGRTGNIKKKQDYGSDDSGIWFPVVSMDVSKGRIPRIKAEPSSRD